MHSLRWGGAAASLSSRLGRLVFDLESSPSILRNFVGWILEFLRVVTYGACLYPRLATIFSVITYIHMYLLRNQFRARFLSFKKIKIAASSRYLTNTLLL